jgi:hypothetical protein
LEGFLKLRPPTFDYADDDPITTEDWLWEIEKKLDLTTCTNEECVGVAAHQFTGAVRTWWDGYCDAHDDPRSLSWEELSPSVSTTCPRASWMPRWRSSTTSPRGL